MPPLLEPRHTRPHAGSPEHRARPPWARIAAPLLLTMHALLAWYARRPGLSTANDDAMYVLLGRALRGLEYREIYHVGSPPHYLFPPGYPAMLALWGGIVGERFDALVIFNIAASTLALGVLFLALKETFSLGFALLGLAALAVNPSLIQSAGSLFSEIPYTLLTLLALGLLTREKAPAPALAGAVAIAAALTRSIGVTLVLALAIHWLLQRRWKRAALFAMACLATVGVWLAWVYVAQERFDGASYVADATHTSGVSRSLPEILALRVASNAAYYFGSALQWFLPIPAIPGTPIDNAITVPLTLAGLGVGLWVLLRRWRPAALYLLAYGGLLVVWSWHIERFVTPIIPLLVVATLAGIGRLARPLGRQGQAGAVAAMAAVLIATGAVETAELLERRSRCERGGRFPAPSCLTGDQAVDQASQYAALAYVDDRLPADAVLLATKRPLPFFYTGRQTVIPEQALAQDSADFLPHLRQEGATHILLGNLTWTESGRMRDLLEANCRGLQTVAFFPPYTYLFRIRERDAPPGPGDACRALAARRRAMTGAEP